MHVAMHGVPPAGLVVQVIDGHAAAGRGSGPNLLTRKFTQSPCEVPKAQVVLTAAGRRRAEPE